MLRFKSHLLAIVILNFCLHQVSGGNEYDDEKYSSRYFYHQKAGDGMSKMRNIPESMSPGKGKALLNKYGKYSKSDVGGDGPKRGMIRAAGFEASTSTTTTVAPAFGKKAPPKIVPGMAKPNETEAEKAERIHRTFEKLLTFVEIVGQVDNYVSTKWKNLVKTVSHLYDEEHEEELRLGLRRFKGCPLATET